jgi:hypothetical protein
LLATIIQVVGLVLISTGIFLVSIPAGITVAGLSCLVLGIAIERSK